MASELELHTIGCAEAEILAQLAPAPVQRYILDHRAAPELHVIGLHRGGSLAQRRPTLQCYGLHCHGMRME